jgi:hypothetical protein
MTHDELLSEIGIAKQELKKIDRLEYELRELPESKKYRRRQLKKRVRTLENNLKNKQKRLF